MALRISRAHQAAIRAAARAAAPHECCGLLLGTVDGRSGDARVQALAPAANVAIDPAHRFEIDPAVLIAAYKAARSGRPAMLGHYHSHPDGAPVPSTTDAEQAEARGEFWLIVGADGDLAGWRAGPDGALHGRFDRVEIAPFAE